MEWTVYILKCKDGTLYTGITNNLTKRLKAHGNGTGARYTRGRGPLKLLYTENHPTKGFALRREAAIKSMGRAEKLKLLPARKRLS